jgi:hypothetical protein
MPISCQTFLEGYPTPGGQVQVHLNGQIIGTVQCPCSPVLHEKWRRDDARRKKKQCDESETGVFDAN